MTELSGVSKNVAPRLAEVQRLLAHIRNLEKAARTDGDTASGEVAASLRGLYFVSLYGVLEYAITQNVQVLIQEIGKLGIRYVDLEHLFHSVALDGAFASMRDAGAGAKWTKRREFLSKQFSADSCALNDNVFQDHLQNLWYETLAMIWSCLCIPGAPAPDPSYRGYIDEIVAKRNETAHGRSSPQKVGRLVTSDGLAVRLGAITALINHVTASFATHLQDRNFISPLQRGRYAGAADTGG